VRAVAVFQGRSTPMWSHLQSNLQEELVWELRERMAPLNQLSLSDSLAYLDP